MLQKLVATLAVCSVISFRKDEFLSRVASLARRAEKHGMTAPIAREVGTHRVPIYRKVDTAQGPVFTDEVIGWHLYFDFEVEHSSMRLPGGWEFLGTVEHTHAGNILRTLCSDERARNLGLETYRQAAPTCDHCQTNRRRKDTYLVLSEAGKVRRVGKSCLKDYLGHEAAKSLGVYQSIARLDDEDWGSDGRYAPPLFDAAVFVATAKASIEEHGWISRSEGGYGDSTADTVLTTLFHCLDLKPSAVRFRDEAVEKYGDFARDALEWAAAIDEANPSSYLQNLRVLAGLGCVESKQAGFMASLPRAYSRELEKQALAARRVNTDEAAREAGYFGKVGDKLAGPLTKKDRDAGRSSWYLNQATGKVVEVENTGKRALRSAGLDSSSLSAIPATVVFRTTREGEVRRGYSWVYVTTTILKMQTDTGHILTWFRSDTFENPPEPGDKVLVSGTIKRHGDYKGVPETVLTRCTISAA